MIVDVHNHYYPPSFIDALRRGPSAITIEDDAEGNPVLISPGDRNFAVRGHRDIDYREQVLEREGVDVQMITLTTPGTTMEPPERSAQLASLVNDALNEIRLTRAHRFTALATLPQNSPAHSVTEFDRAMSLGFAGVMMFASCRGVSLYDQAMWPVYERANAHGAVIHIHPNYPAGVEAMQEYWLMPLVGFLFDTTLAAAGLVYSGVVERFPRIRWVLGHLGGAIPYLVERLDRGFEAYPECRVNISRPPSDYLKRFYYDTVNFDTRALQLAVDFAGAGQILAGSDYPHLIGSIAKMKSSISALAIPEADKARILGGNAVDLLGLGRAG
ncbi:MAG: amidohydrolase family protein [Gemmatimonadaceae bacterium]